MFHPLVSRGRTWTLGRLRGQLARAEVGASFALTADGLPEIQSLSYLDFEVDFPDPMPVQRLALVLVESRLPNASGDASLRAALMRRMRRFKFHLRAEGLTSTHPRRALCLDPHRPTMDRTLARLIARRRRQCSTLAGDWRLLHRGRAGGVAGAPPAPSGIVESIRRAAADELHCLGAALPRRRGRRLAQE